MRWKWNEKEVFKRSLKDEKKQRKNQLKRINFRHHTLWSWPWWRVWSTTKVSNGPVEAHGHEKDCDSHQTLSESHEQKVWPKKPIFSKSEMAHGHGHWSWPKVNFRYELVTPYNYGHDGARVGILERKKVTKRQQKVGTKVHLKGNFGRTLLRFVGDLND